MYDKVLILFAVVGVGCVSAKAQFPVNTTSSYFANPTSAPISFQQFGGSFGTNNQQLPTLRDFSNAAFGDYATSNPFQQHGSQECSLCKRKFNNTDDAIQIGFSKQFSPAFSQSVNKDFETNQISTDASNSNEQSTDSFIQTNALHRENVVIMPPSSTSFPESQNLEDSEKPEPREPESRAYLPMTSKPVLDSDDSLKKETEESENNSSEKPSHPTLNSFPNAPNPLDTAPEISVRFGSESESSTNKPYGALSQANAEVNVPSSPQTTGIPYTPISQTPNSFLTSPVSAGSPNIVLPQTYSPYNFRNPYYSGISRGGFAGSYSPYSLSNFSPYSRGSLYSTPFGYNRFGYNPYSYVPSNIPSVYNNGYFRNRFGYSGVPRIPSYYPFGYNRNAIYQNRLSPLAFGYQNPNFNRAQFNTFNAGQYSVPQPPVNYGGASVSSSTFVPPTASTPGYSAGSTRYNVPGFNQPGFSLSSTSAPLQFNYQNSNVNPTQVPQSSAQFNAGQSSGPPNAGGSPLNYAGPGSVASSTFAPPTASTPGYSTGSSPYSVSSFSQPGFAQSSTSAPFQFNYVNPTQFPQRSPQFYAGQPFIPQTVGGSPPNYGAPTSFGSPTFASSTVATPAYTAGSFPYSFSGSSQPGYVQSTTSSSLPVSYQNSNLNTAHVSQSSTPISNTVNAGQSTPVPQTNGGPPSNFATPGSSTFISSTPSTPTYSAVPYSASGFGQSGYVPSSTPAPFYSTPSYSFSNFGQPSFATSTVATPYSAAPGFPQINYNGQPAQ